MEPTTAIPPDALRVINVASLVLFTVGAIAGAVLTVARWFRYRVVNHEEPPELLIRDMWARLFLALPFAAVLTLRALGIDPYSEWWGSIWFAASAIIAVLGVWLYVYYEMFVIERDVVDARGPCQDPPPSDASQRRP